MNQVINANIQMEPLSEAAKLPSSSMCKQDKDKIWKLNPQKITKTAKKSIWQEIKMWQDLEFEEAEFDKEGSNENNESSKRTKNKSIVISKSENKEEG